MHLYTIIIRQTRFLYSSFLLRWFHVICFINFSWSWLLREVDGIMYFGAQSMLLKTTSEKMLSGHFHLCKWKSCNSLGTKTRAIRILYFRVVTRSDWIFFNWREYVWYKLVTFSETALVPLMFVCKCTTDFIKCAISLCQLFRSFLEKSTFYVLSCERLSYLTLFCQMYCKTGLNNLIFNNNNKVFLSCNIKIKLL